MISTTKSAGACTAAVALIAALLIFAAPTNAAPHGATCRFAGASVQLLATVVNTRDTQVHCLGLDVDANRDITDIRIESHDANDPAGAIRLKRVPITTVASDHGAVLDGNRGHDALILQGRIKAASSSARLVIRYLHNGITGEFRSCVVSLDKNTAGDWTLVNAQDRAVSRIVVKTWKVPLLGTIGIDTLEGACAA